MEPVVINGVSAISGKTFATDPIAYIKRARSVIGNTAQRNAIVAIAAQMAFEHFLSFLEHRGWIGSLLDGRSISASGSFVFDGIAFCWSPNTPPGEMRFYDISKDDSSLEFVGNIVNISL